MKSFSNIKFKQEYDETVMKELHSLAKFAVLEDFVPDYYGETDEKAKEALKKHIQIFDKYPQYYEELFTTPDLTKHYLDCHMIIASLFLMLRDVDLEIVLEIIQKVQINRSFLFFTNALISERLIGVKLSKADVRGLFYEFLQRLEQEKGKDYCAFFAVKYRNKLQALFASFRIKRKKLSECWKELMDFLFVNKTERKTWTFEILREIFALRHEAKVKEVKKIPFTSLIGYAWKILKKRGYTTEEIKEYLMSRTDLMSNTEVKRALRQLQETGKLETKEQKEKIEKRVSRAPSDVFSLLNALFVLESNSQEITKKAIEKKVEKLTKDLKNLFKTKKVGIAIDVSRNTIGSEKQIGPKKIVMRRTFDKNILSAFILQKVSKSGEVYLFNEVVEKVELPELQQLLQQIKQFEPDGGSAPYYALKRLIAENYDAIVLISDFNENIPIRGILSIRLPELARSYKKPIFLLQTELDITEITALEKVVFEEQLENVYLIPIKRLEHLKQVLEAIELDKEIKKVIIEIMHKRKDVEVFA